VECSLEFDDFTRWLFECSFLLLNNISRFAYRTFAKYVVFLNCAL
jgi:hypothetical protein